MTGLKVIVFNEEEVQRRDWVRRRMPKIRIFLVIYLLKKNRIFL
jgi:hypothetical protein